MLNLGSVRKSQIASKCLSRSDFFGQDKESLEKVDRSTAENDLFVWITVLSTLALCHCLGGASWGMGRSMLFYSQGFRSEAIYAFTDIHERGKKLSINKSKLRRSMEMSSLG